MVETYPAEPVVTRDEHRSRYILRLGEEAAGYAQFREEDGRAVFFHTEVRHAYDGHGLGTTLVRKALEDVRGRGLRIVPQCPFVAAFLRRHHEFDDLVDPV
ncbi:N-acetyltransferase [Actinotalea sp. BY-33]|uniref:N-acetyltransferase n=1 Tax=Actinotalea soli TaxID=2819234 RepID=A0A939LSA4_9CELL|nr:GNAT family N-acetyltransferase [Actinotalea soli]MBO1752943.1 N-acetyltransferase [Actinotalea soli]